MTTNWITDAPDPPPLKVNLRPYRPGENLLNFDDAADFNDIWQALVDTRTAVLAGGGGGGYATLYNSTTPAATRTKIKVDGTLLAFSDGTLTDSDKTLLTAPGLVPATRTLTAGTGISAIGDLSANRTIGLANTAVTPGSYTYGGFTVDAQGRITAAASGTAPVTSVSAGTDISVTGTTTPTVSLPATLTSQHNMQQATAANAPLTLEQTGSAAANHLLSLKQGGAEKGYLWLDSSSRVAVHSGAYDYYFGTDAFFYTPGLLSSSGLVWLQNGTDTLALQNSSVGGARLSLGNTQPLVLGTNSNTTTHLVLKGDGASVGIGVAAASIAHTLHVAGDALFDATTAKVKVNNNETSAATAVYLANIQNASALTGYRAFGADVGSGSSSVTGLGLRNTAAADGTTRTQSPPNIRFQGSGDISSTVYSQHWLIQHEAFGSAGADTDATKRAGTLWFYHANDGSTFSGVFALAQGAIGMYGTTPVAQHTAFSVNGSAQAATTALGAAASAGYVQAEMQNLQGVVRQILNCIGATQGGVGISA